MPKILDAGLPDKNPIVVMNVIVPTVRRTFTHTMHSNTNEFPLTEKTLKEASARCILFIQEQMAKELQNDRNA